MTIIAAAYDSPTSYAIAADSYSVVNGIRIPNAHKVVRAGPVLIGGAGCNHETSAGLAWMAGRSWTVHRDIRVALAGMRKYILEETERNGDCKGLDSHYIAVGPDGVYLLGSNGGIMQAPSRWAIGCGEDVALGAMWERPGAPVDVVALAVRAACGLREGCFGGPVVLGSEATATPSP